MQHLSLKLLKQKLLDFGTLCQVFSSRLPFVSSRELVNGDRCYVCTCLFLCRVQNGLKRQLLHDRRKRKNNKKMWCFWCSFPVGFFLKPNSRANRTWSTLLITFFFFMSQYLHFTSFSREALSSVSALNFSTTLTLSSTRLKTGPRHSTRRSWHLKFGKFLALTELLQICGDSRDNSGSFHCFCFKTSDRACHPGNNIKGCERRTTF